MYPIAVRFSEHARRVAASKTYRPNEFGDKARTSREECPIAVCLAVDGYVQEHENVNAPDAYEIAKYLGYSSSCYVSIEAFNFVDDWDTGKIADLAEALGV